MTHSLSRFSPDFVKLGDIQVYEGEKVYSSVLGSCVSVCIFDTRLSLAGISHFSLPHAPDKTSEASLYRYGDASTRKLIRELKIQAKGRPLSLRAKIVGGASNNQFIDVGVENIKVAREILRENSIPIVGEDVGGGFGRKILFHTNDGRLQVADIDETQVLAKRSRVRVLVVDDSRTVREVLKKQLQSSDAIEVVGLAADAVEAEELVRQLNPDVVTLDLNMPKVSGLEWLEKLLSVRYQAVVIISSVRYEDGNEVFRALELGAVDYIEKPYLKSWEDSCALIVEKIIAASRAKPRIRSSSKLTTSSDKLVLNKKRLVIVGASTGGTEAIREYLLGMPSQIPPVLIVQHIPSPFSKAFADRLNQLLPFTVKEAEHNDPIIPNTVYVAPGGMQMSLYQRSNAQLVVKITDDPPMNRHKPSVDFLFHSVADLMAPQTLAILLTGMGEDGAKGLLDIRKKGGRTIAQDEKSCVVFGMPKAAISLEAAEFIEPLEKIAGKSVELLNQTSWKMFKKSS